MRNLAAIEIRRIKVALEQAERRLALSRISGKVHEVDAEKRLLRLKLGETAEGKPVLSPWVRWQEATAGGMRIHSQPAVGEQMDLVSASGTVGAASLAAPATYDRDHQAPSKSSDTAVFERGGGRIELGPDGIVLKGNVRAEGGVLTHDGVNVGKDHLHTGDDLDGITGPPEQ